MYDPIYRLYNLNLHNPYNEFFEFCGFKNMVNYINDRYWHVKSPLTDKETFRQIRDLGTLTPGKRFISLQYNFIVERFL